ncbi:MAG: homoserine dehydrogenase [Bacilli bacterium]|nr:homoserine dehydrogenase [Bacilli bacterium]
MKIAILGYGTIGKGVFQIACENPHLQVVKILEREERFDQNYLDLFTSNVDEIVNNQEIELVVEVLGGYTFAEDAIEKCLKAGKHVVTANKEVIAIDIENLLALAKTNNVSLAYEASVGGGIPIIKNLKEIKKVNKISKITGILNGTTNYILTKMFEGNTFEEALLDAQKKGFAESDPTADLEGYDMMRKIAILSDLAFDTYIDINQIPQKGIKEISKEVVDEAKKNNQVIKFVCSAKLEENKLSVEVKPEYFPNNHFFASVNNEFNAVILETYPNDELIFIGKGAGSLPTSSAIIADIIDIKDNLYLENYQNINKYEINK